MRIPKILGTVQDGHTYEAQEETGEKKTGKGMWISFEFSFLRVLGKLYSRAASNNAASQGTI